MKLITWNTGASGAPDNTYEADKVSPLYGLVYDVSKDVSVFATHATSLFPDSSKDSFGNQFAPQVGKSHEFGVKFDLAENKLSGTVRYFQIDQEGGSAQVAPHGNRNTSQFDTIVNNSSLTDEQKDAQLEQLFGPSADPTPAYRQQLASAGDRVPAGKQRAKGFDIDLIDQPSTAWQFVFSYEHVDHKNITSPDPSIIGQTNPQAIKDRYALLTKYTFTEGGAKGAFVGLGVWGGTKALQDYAGPNGAPATSLPAELSFGDGKWPDGVPPRHADRLLRRAARGHQALTRPRTRVTVP